MRLEYNYYSILMKFFIHAIKLSVLLPLIFPFISNAQTDTSFDFPITGIYEVESNETNPSNRYNILEFKEDIYFLKMDEKELFSFKAIGLNDGLYSIQQLTYGDNVLDENSDKPTSFQIKIEEVNTNIYQVSFIFPNRTETIRIIKS